MNGFLTEDTVLVNDYSGLDPDYGSRLRKLLSRQGLRCEVLPHFVERRVRRGIPSAVGNYVNYLRTAGVVVVPVYGVPTDAVVLGKMEELFAGVPVVPLPCTELAREGGGLNCVTWTTRDRTGPQ